MCFSKHQQLRAHICSEHAPSGTKPYQCDHTGCTKSFSTNQKLRTHSKTHDDKRYTCSHPACISTPEIAYYPTWTNLQAHIRAQHPPTCPYPQCKGKTFTQQRGLKAHLKIHGEREAEENVDHIVMDEGDEEESKRRRGGEYGRDWKCPVDDCDKEFKSVCLILLFHFCNADMKRTEKSAKHPPQHIASWEKGLYVPL